MGDSQDLGSNTIETDMDVRESGINTGGMRSSIDEHMDTQHTHTHLLTHTHTYSHTRTPTHTHTLTLSHTHIHIVTH